MAIWKDSRVKFGLNVCNGSIGVLKQNYFKVAQKKTLKM
jgi:hypothetical protein